MKDTLPKPDLPGDDFDGDLILTFLTEFHLLEQALIRAGFTRAGRIYRNAQPDWTRFIRHIEPRFDPDSSPALQGAVSYLLYDPDKLALRERRLEDSLPGETCSADSDILWLAELVQGARIKLTYGIPFLKETDFDPAYVMAALMVVEAWANCDPPIERLHHD